MSGCGNKSIQFLPYIHDEELIQLRIIVHEKNIYKYKLVAEYYSNLMHLWILNSLRKQREKKRIREKKKDLLTSLTILFNYMLKVKLIVSKANEIMNVK